MTLERWEVGPEHDNELFLRLGTILKAMGFDLGSQWSGMAGSQDISHWSLTSSEGTLVIDAETYMGLSVQGPPELVGRVRESFNA
jgi:hypothetical protein